MSEAGAVSSLRCWFQRRQVIEREPFQSFLVGATGTAATVEAAILIEKLGEELLRGRFRGGVSGSPYLLPVGLNPNPAG
jgi:hypothetical protein